MGSPAGLGGFASAVQDRVLLVLWVLGLGWAWISGPRGGVGGAWVRHGKLSDVDVAAIMVAVAMLLFSFAPSYVFVHRPLGPEACSFSDQVEQARCQLENLKTDWSTPTGLNAWHQTSTLLPTLLVVAVGFAVALRATFPLMLPAILVRLATRVMLLVAGWVIGWAVFNPSTEIFQSMHYGWGLWASVGCLVLMSLMAMPTPPRFLGWMVK